MDTTIDLPGMSAAAGQTSRFCIRVCASKSRRSTAPGTDTRSRVGEFESRAAADARSLITILAPLIYGSNTSGVNGVFASSAAVWWPMAMSIKAA